MSEYLVTAESVSSSKKDILGGWFTQDIKTYDYPFRHCVIDNFLDETTFVALQREYPSNPNEKWWSYSNPLEVKFAFDKLDLLSDEVRNIFLALSTPEIRNRIGEIFGIDRLEYDPYCHGGGLHMHPRGGRLAMHLDYEKHPTLDNKQRRLNIILYANETWDDSWNGDTQLWDANMRNCVVKSFPKRNRAIIFETCEESWHGVPEIISCPEGEYRKTLAFYYLTDLESRPASNKVGANESGYRTKATFVQRPCDKPDDRIKELMKIRPTRRITNEDMQRIWPEWKP